MPSPTHLLRHASRAVLAAAALALAGASFPSTGASHPAGPGGDHAPRSGIELRITGVVTDAESGRPLASAQVFLPAVSAGALTDARGRYVIRVPDGALGSTPLELRAELIGYSPATASIDQEALRADGEVRVDFQLRGTALRLQELVVSSAGDGTVAEAAAYSPGIMLPSPPPADREQYARIDENDFRSALDVSLSTFSIDVDRASYSNIRRFLLREGRLPPIDAVQIEEMVNYFPYDYDLPRGDHPIAVTTELGDSPWREGHQLLRIGIASTPIAMEEPPPANLVFLLDTSGSMFSADKLPLVKRALRLLVNQMREEDRVALVAYAGSAGLVLEPTSGADRERILDALDQLEAGGSTAGGDGLRLAYDVAREHFVEGGNNRVILATDGDFNVGESSDAAMTRLVEERREEGTFLTVLGFGTGNLQNTKMQEMAQHGNGNYAYIDGLDEARKVLVGEMGGTLLTVAADVKVQVEFNPARVRAYRLIGYENRLLADEDFNDDEKDAGEMGAGHTVTALYDIVPVGSASEVGGGSVDPLRYQASDGPVVEGDPGELAFVKVRYKEPGGEESRLLSEAVSAEPAERPSVDFRFASAVAGFGMLLRESDHRGSATAARVHDLAESGLGRDLDGYRSGFLEMVRAYRMILDGIGTDGGER